MASYLEEAAALLRKASAENESSNKRYPVNLRAGRMRIAGEFAKLAAIEKGIVPPGGQGDGEDLGED